MTSAQADARFWLAMIQRGRITPAAALADLEMSPAHQKMVQRFIDDGNPDLASEFSRIIAHRRSAAGELRKLLGSEGRA